ncbi:hypothetical protein CISG_04390 [Coccidioides immitis RMSCC 3703]|uniref:Uncharacterized protein n=1 Tax=Coccidioides immitis RMSCC 3703 TaxID=454286 RepID=A0A0J8QV21_COCIT|nr:hypothetical protein CISG_04390 [Coccidioides immitis RMSCC 3703]
MIAGLATEQRKAPSASVSAFFETKSKKFFAAIEKATGYYAKAAHGHPGAPFPFSASAACGISNAYGSSVVLFATWSTPMNMPSLEITSESGVTAASRP